jgi:ribosomal protein S18 acetylase RimI-like enzyme
VEIREYRGSDETQWLRCRVLAFLDTAYFDAVVTEKPVLEPQAIELVGVLGDEIIGLCDVEVDGELATIDTIAVHPDFRTRGVGTALCVEAARRAVALGAHTLDAWTREDPDTLRWYQAQGFVESEHYLHVYADYYADPGEPDRAVVRRPGLRPIKLFLHAPITQEAAMRKQFQRVHVCRRFSMELVA